MEDVSSAALGAAARIIEIQLPLHVLEIGPGGVFELRLEWSFHDRPFQVIPYGEAIRIAVPDGRAYAANWQV